MGLGASLVVVILLWKLISYLRKDEDINAMTIENLFEGKLYKLGDENQELFKMLDTKGPYPKSMENQG